MYFILMTSIPTAIINTQAKIYILYATIIVTFAHFAAIFSVLFIKTSDTNKKFYKAKKISRIFFREHY